MKLTYLYFTIALIAISQIAFAQNDSVRRERRDNPMRNMTAEQIAKFQTKVLKDSLNLTAEQEPKIDAIHLKYAQKMKEVQDSDMERMEKFQEMRTSREDQDFELKKALTKEQLKKFQAMREAQAQRMRERRPRREGGNPDDNR